MLNKGICPSREDPVSAGVCYYMVSGMTFEDLLCLQVFSLQQTRPINQVDRCAFQNGNSVFYLHQNKCKVKVKLII